MFKRLENPINNLGVEIVDVIISVLQSKNKIASGRLIKSIRYEYMADIESIKLLIYSEDYLTYIDRGRKPGKYVPISALKEWAKYKGIPEKAVWAINKNIFKFGIKPLNFIYDIKQRYSKRDKFGVVTREYTKIISEYLTQELKKAQKNMN